MTNTGERETHRRQGGAVLAVACSAVGRPEFLSAQQPLQPSALCQPSALLQPSAARNSVQRNSGSGSPP